MDSLIAPIEAPRAVVDEFRVGFQAKAALAAVRQERLAAACKTIESRLVDGVGQLKYQIDADMYFLLRQKFGAGCMRDKDFLRDCERKGLLTPVRGRSDKTTVRVNGLRQTPRHN